MLEPLLSSKVKERILFYLLTHGEAYPREMAAALGNALDTVQQQLRRLEDGGVVSSRLRGKVRLFALNPRYAFRRELAALLGKALEFLPRDDRERLYLPRLRPRRTGKP